jgi:hypothetical protein
MRTHEERRGMHLSLKYFVVAFKSDAVIRRMSVRLIETSQQCAFVAAARPAKLSSSC